MKKTSLLVALPAVAMTALLLSGCGLFRSHKAWDTAQQEAPLEIPPSLDRPSTSAALVIPPRGANQPTANGATAGVAAPDGQIADAFVVTDTLDNTYHRVGEALKDGSVGQVTAHDDASHSYTLSVTGASAKKKGLFHRVFGFMKRDNDGSATAAHPVQISIAASGASASEVRAQGDAAAVVKVMDSLRSRVGG